MRKILIRLGLALIVLIGAGFVLLRTNETVQDNVVRRAIVQVLQNAGQTQFGGDALDVVFCGTASPMGAGRAQQCMAVLAGDKFFIVDAGARSAHNVTNYGLPVNRLDGVLLTHFHSDHISALGEMHLASWARGRTEKLKLFGGPGVERVAAGFDMAYGQDYIYRTAHHGEAYMPSEAAGFEPRLIYAPTQGTVEIYNQDGLVITAFAVPHAPVEPAYGYRFDYGGRSVVISGDTSKSFALAAAAKGADVLIHEVLQPDLVAMTIDGLTQIGQERLGKILHDTLDYHTTPVEAAEIANQANAGLLVFTHYAPVPVNAIVQRYFLRGVEDIRPEGALLADDGTWIHIPLEQDAQPHIKTLE